MAYVSCRVCTFDDRHMPHLLGQLAITLRLVPSVEFFVSLFGRIVMVTVFFSAIVGAGFRWCGIFGCEPGRSIEFKWERGSGKLEIKHDWCERWTQTQKPPIACIRCGNSKRIFCPETTWRRPNNGNASADITAIYLIVFVCHFRWSFSICTHTQRYASITSKQYSRWVKKNLSKNGRRK